jgi:hypothetical protein
MLGISGDLEGNKNSQTSLAPAVFNDLFFSSDLF